MSARLSIRSNPPNAATDNTERTHSANITMTDRRRRVRANVLNLVQLVVREVTEQKKLLHVTEDDGSVCKTQQYIYKTYAQLSHSV